METVYLETSVVSYLTARPSRDVVVAAHQRLTREWWDSHRAEFGCYLSQVVIDEASAGDIQAASARLRMIADIPVLEASDAAEELTQCILTEGALPAKAARDAAHVAIASVYEIDYLLTWNCTHLANAQLIRPVAAVCYREGFVIPVICTPGELMGVL